MSEVVAVFQAQAPNEIASAVVMDSEVTVSDNATARVDSESAHVSTPEGTVSLGVTASTDSVLSEPILMEDGSALVAIVINEPVADTAFRMPLELPDAAAATLEDDGSVLIMNPEGEFIAGIARPWARDVNGSDVPTSFELDGDTLIQHVDLTSVPVDAYPVVADPWAGRDLVAAAWVTTQGGSKYVINAVPTSWGEFYRGIATLESHLADLKADLGTNKSKVTSTIINQFYCHVAYGWLGGGATYNMESWRKDVLWSVQGNPITKCNP
ncbi:MAG: DUF2599 domain-containing protein [Rhodoglobus sp.]|nr:DUF2599 domain-containing protein [Rhodoglobus sp.]